MDQHGSPCCKFSVRSCPDPGGEDSRSGSFSLFTTTFAISLCGSDFTWASPPVSHTGAWGCKNFTEFPWTSIKRNQKNISKHITQHIQIHPNTWTYPKCLVVEVASGACHLETVLLAVFHDLFLWWRPHRMAPKHSQTIIPNGFTWIHIFELTKCISLYIYIYICVYDCVCMYMCLYICTYSFNMF